MRLALEASPVAAVSLVGVVVIESAIGVGLLVAGGRLVGAIASAVTGHDSGKVTGAVVLLAVLYAANNVVPAVRSVLAVWLADRIDQIIRIRLMTKMLAPVGITHLEDADIRDDVSRAGSLNGFSPGQVIEGLAGILQIRLASLGAVAIVASYRWWLAAVLLFVALATEAAARRQYMQIARIVYRQTQDLRRSDYYRSLVMGAAAKELRVFGLVDWLEGRFAEYWLEAMTEVWRERGQEDRYILWSGPLHVIANGAAYLLVGDQAARGEISLARMTVLIGAIGAVRSIISYGLDRTRTEYGATAYLPILDLDEKIAGHALRKVDGSREAAGLPVTEIRFDNVSFRYPGRDTDVFTGLNLTIPAGRSMAIVGTNGAGKTTLCKLLARCYEPTGGRILVDGVDIQDLDPAAWQQRIAAVFQDFVTFPLSVRDNIGFGAVANVEDQAALDAAAAEAAVTGIIEGLANGWDSVLSKVFTAGTELSGGEAQRVALARALFALRHGAGVLMLDEPTASLDVRTEAELFDRYLELTRGVTSILISHRFSTVRHAQRICVLSGGTVVEEGSHEDLMALGGPYHAMFSLQASRFAEVDADD
ncbi:MAG: ATP-binding cassette, subfamily bacterial [Actinomycetota bacterium]|jgi:ATP-binding cassette subfamily B protein